MTYKACGHRIMCLADVVEQKTKGGILKPDQTVDMERAGVNSGVVLDIGPTAWKSEVLGGVPWCKVGDRIRWPRYAGAIVRDGDIDYHFINDEDVLSVEVTDE